MIDLQAAEQLLDFSRRLEPDASGQRRSREQLEGAVAIHNILNRHGVAYLADEVGMGKTYVALGAMALFRHFNPGFRVMIIAPRQNIQMKWINELRNFTQYNVKVNDLRVRAVDGGPARPIARCESLLDLVRESVLDDRRDFVARMTSFSLGLGGTTDVDAASADRLRRALRTYLPWLPGEIFDLRSRQEFKDNIAQAICCALPVFDLLIVDEGHHLKHGFRENVAARNRVLGLAFGHPSGRRRQDLFPGYGPRAKRVLFLSATPIEESYLHLWNQLEVFGLGYKFPELKSQEESDEVKKRVASDFLVRRVTAINIAGAEHTRNMYRREWRRGGMKTHDQPIEVTDDRRRLVVALVQKKVSEILQHERFGACFEMGMLASFESFLETAKVKGDESPFDDPDQADRAEERDGIDVDSINGLARSYRKAFGGREMPHPKMDELVDALDGSWNRGRKALVFVRRVASVKEIKRKLDERYDHWLIGRVRSELPINAQRQFDAIVDKYQVERASVVEKLGVSGVPGTFGADPAGADQGAQDTFFAWFFRGEGPKGVFSGARLQERLQVASSAYATFFQDNWVAWVLQCPPRQVADRLSEVTNRSPSDLAEQLRVGSADFLPSAQRLARGDRFFAVQAAAVRLLTEVQGPSHRRALAAWHGKFLTSKRAKPRAEAPEIGEFLTEETLFTRLDAYPALKETLFPPRTGVLAQDEFRERELRRELLQAAARLGHAFVDLYVLVVQGVDSLSLRSREDTESLPSAVLIERYIELIERQRQTPLESREWGAYDELSQIAEHFETILDLNLPGLRNVPNLGDCSVQVGQLFGRQQPIGGMSGQVNQTLVRQFRLPGYPFVLVTTDLLQEGEDLHTFCDRVYHYGISWTPSAMEQRTGRIDRVRSLTERRLGRLEREPGGDEKLQVYMPYLRETVELLQVKRVLSRMDTFLRLMHSNLAVKVTGDHKVNTQREFARAATIPESITGRLESAFPVQDKLLVGRYRGLVVGVNAGDRAMERLQGLKGSRVGGLDIQWDESSAPGTLLGTAHFEGRRQPFSLFLQSRDGRLYVRCISPIGRVGIGIRDDEITEVLLQRPIRIGAVITDNNQYDLTLEDIVALAVDETHDKARVGALLRRVIKRADEIERALIPGQDAAMEAFTPQLQKEFRDGR